MSLLRCRGREQRGNASVEYALILVLIGLAAIAGLSLFGQSVSDEVGVVADKAESLFGGGGSGAGSSGSGSSGAAGHGHGYGSGHGAGNGGSNNGNGSGGHDSGTGNGK